MPKSKNKRKNGKVKKANGAGSLDNVRQGKPALRPIPRYATEFNDKLKELPALVLPTPEEIKMASMLYGVTNPDTIRAARAVLDDTQKAVEDMLTDLTNGQS